MDSINLPAETSITVPNFNTGTLDRDLAIQTLSDEKNGFAAKCGALEAERAKLTAEAAELKGQVKSLNFELTALKDSLTKGPGRSRSSAEREGGVHLGSPGNSFWGMISRSWG
ncbi:MAG: hypothetical protein LBK52_00195 [Deltaproteobacteria bacterium]|nr:hypothetical protein [Deltaproteobacteria bacterium]